MPPTATVAPAEVPLGTEGTCAAWYQTTGSDDCDLLATMFGTFSKHEFIKWNPVVWSDCSNIKVSPTRHSYINSFRNIITELKSRKTPGTA